jgi:predicted nucleic-acid-binding Zn-ribbon protein
MSGENRVCQNCGGGPLYAKKGVPSGGLHGPNLLPGLGALLQFADFEVVACENCGFAQFFIAKSYRKNLAKTWKCISDTTTAFRPNPAAQSELSEDEAPSDAP